MRRVWLVAPCAHREKKNRSVQNSPSIFVRRKKTSGATTSKIDYLPICRRLLCFFRGLNINRRQIGGDNKTSALVNTLPGAGTRSSRVNKSNRARDRETARGLYHPETDCIMFIRYPKRFCETARRDSNGSSGCTLSEGRFRGKLVSRRLKSPTRQSRTVPPAH